MFEDGYITKDEVVRCITYLFCFSENIDTRRIAKHIKEFKDCHIPRRRIARKVALFDRRVAWEAFFCRNANFKRIMEVRRITDIDCLLYRSWDYYDLDMPKHRGFSNLTAYGDDIEHFY